MKTNKRSNYLLLVLAICLAQTIHLNAQVTIGSNNPPDENALLDLKETGTTSSKGFLLPRVALTSTTSYAPLKNSPEKGMTVYNTSTVNDVTPGYYYNDGTKWVRLYTEPDLFFYMPSINLPIDISDPSYSGGKFTVDLYSKYSAQFGTTGTIKNPGASSILKVYKKDELDYLVIYYDEDVFATVSVGNDGKLVYSLKPGMVITEKTFMNIVFKVK